jgi:hypothetical protein
MSNLYVKVFTGFYTHRKTLRLKTALGDDAYWIPPRLWAYAVESQPDGIFENYSADEIATLISYKGDASRMLQALLKVGFMDDSPLRIHDWIEHNEYHATFKNRAKNAALARWSKRTPPKPSPNTENGEREGEGVSIAISNASSIPLLSGSDKQIKNDEKKEIIRELRQLGTLRDHDKGSKNYNRILELEAALVEVRKILGVIA